LRGGKEEAKSSYENTAALNIWLYDRRGGSLQRLTSGGGYTSLMPSIDGARISFIKGNALGTLDIRQGAERVVDDHLTYQRILAWNRDSGEFLVSTQDNRVFRVKESDGSSVEITFDTQHSPLEERFANLDTLVNLSRTTSKLTTISAAELIPGKWMVLEDYKDYPEPKVLLELDRPIRDAVITQDGSAILFLSKS
jgi:hypothetical protein